MDPVFKKMNFKAHSDVLVINTPDSFRENMKAMEGLTSFHEHVDDLAELEFIIAFVTQKAQIDQLVPQIAPKLKGDALIWFCYPKGTSKNYTCDFNRDTGWEIMGKYGLEGVRMVAIDADWSALRFRQVAYIKTMKRRESFALSKEGKQKAAKKGE